MEDVSEQAAKGLLEAARALMASQKVWIAGLLRTHGGVSVARPDYAPGRLNGCRKFREEFFRFETSEGARAFLEEGKRRYQFGLCLSASGVLTEIEWNAR